MVPAVPEKISEYIPTSVGEMIPYNPRFVGYWDNESSFCIAGQSHPGTCRVEVPYDLQGMGGNFANSLEYSLKKGSKYMALAAHVQGGNGYLFTFDDIVGEPVPVNGHPKMNVVCSPEEADKYCGCADGNCAPGGARLWAVYQLHA